MSSKKSDKCVFCKDATDSVEDMLLWCPIIKTLWSDINKWLSEMFFLDYSPAESREILGDLENSPIINSFILLTKKVIYDSLKKGKKPSLVHIKNEVKNPHYLEKYNHYISRRRQLLEKNGTL